LEERTFAKKGEDGEMVLMVAYDLHNPGRDYKDVIAKLKTLGSWAHAQESVWLLDTTIGTSTVVDSLLAAGDANDSYVVARLQHDVSWHNIGTKPAFRAEVEKWLRSASRTW
jgi:hypothetical protein